MSDFPPELKPLWPIMPDRVDDYLRKLGVDIVLLIPTDDDPPGTSAHVHMQGPSFPALGWDTPEAATVVEKAADYAQRRGLDLDGLYEVVSEALEELKP